jgi:hypothetical protein
MFQAIARSLDCKIWAKPARVKTWAALQEMVLHVLAHLIFIIRPREIKTNS